MNLPVLGAWDHAPRALEKLEDSATATVEREANPVTLHAPREDVRRWVERQRGRRPL